MMMRSKRPRMHSRSGRVDVFDIVYVTVSEIQNCLLLQGSLEPLPRPPANPGDSTYEDLVDAALPLGVPLPPLQSDGDQDQFGSRGTGAASPAKPPQPLDVLVPAETRVVAVTGGDGMTLCWRMQLLWPTCSAGDGVTMIPRDYLRRLGGCRFTLTIMTSFLLSDSWRDLLSWSGPNTGGKTASLKALGLAVLMAKAGMFLPVLPGSPGAVALTAAPLARTHSSNSLFRTRNQDNCTLSLVPVSQCMS